jgi:hypothetical protein
VDVMGFAKESPGQDSILFGELGPAEADQARKGNKE